MSTHLRDLPTAGQVVVPVVEIDDVEPVEDVPYAIYVPPNKFCCPVDKAFFKSPPAR